MAEYKKAKFKFLKDYKDVAKKGDIKPGRWQSDWKQVELFNYNSLGVLMRKFYVPMTELGITIQKIEEDKPKPETKPKPNGAPVVDTQTDENNDDKDGGTLKDKLSKVFTKKNIIIGSVIFVVLIVGYNVIARKGKAKRK